MAIRRLADRGKFRPGEARKNSPVTTLPTVKAMEDCFEKYLGLIVADGSASQDTRKTYRNRLHQFLSWCQEKEVYPALVTKSQIQEYRKHLIDESKSCATISLSLVVLKHFYQACLAQKLVKENPTLGVKAPREKREIGSSLNFLSLDELQKLMNSIKPRENRQDTAQLQFNRDKILLGCMALQGCRSIEMYRANLGDISHSYGQYYFKLDGKNSIRTIILRSELAEEVAKYRQARWSQGEELSASSPLFISLSNLSYGQRLSRRGIGFIVDKYLHKCGLKYLDGQRNHSAHSLRHTAGTLSLQSGSSLREVQDFLGHSDPKTTAVYTHVLSSQENNPASRIEIDF